MVKLHVSNVFPWAYTDMSNTSIMSMNIVPAHQCGYHVEGFVRRQLHLALDQLPYWLSVQ